jgi:dTDP-4-dehydrorhamnose reductase
MKILLLGREGQVGWELQRALSPLGELIALCSQSQHNPHQLCGDLNDLDGLTTTVRQVAPDLIVNAAAYTAVDRAESEPDQAHRVNALAPQVLASEARRLQSWLLHYSTDYVFDGSGKRPWEETDACAPLNVYGQSKWQGEQAVAGTERHLILRTSWVYGARGGNFAKTMLRLAAQRDALNVINDQIGAPTSAELLADVSAHAIRAAMKNPALAGLYHCVAAGETSWHGYARFVLAQAQALGMTLKAGPEQVTPIPTSSYPTPARRPLNSRLNTHLLTQAFGLRMPEWQTGVARMLNEISGKP